MRRLITSRRLDAGLWSTADNCQKGAMVAAMCFMACSLWFTWMNEAMYFAQAQEIQYARNNVVELPCSTSGNDLAGRSYGHTPVHLQGCKLSGLQNFTDDFPGLESLQNFHENLPKNGIKGAYFRVHLQQGSRRRDGGWDKVSEVKNLEETTVYSASARIGEYQVPDQVLSVLPGSIVPLRQSLNFQQEVSGWHGVKNPYSSKNMVVHDDRLFTATSDTSDDPGYSDDVMMWFTVANSVEVSVLARQPVPGQLAPWIVKDFGVDFTLSYGGSVPANEMLDDLQTDSTIEAEAVRIVNVLICWVATWFLVFPAYAIDCLFNKRSQQHGKDCGACLRALPVSLMFTLTVMATSWTFQRNPMLTIGGSVILLLICLLLAAGYSPFSSRNELVGGAVRLPDPSQLLVVGSRVRTTTTTTTSTGIRACGAEGTIQAVDPAAYDGMPYKVFFDVDTFSDWFKEDMVESLAERESSDPEEALTQPPATSATQTPQEQLSVPLLPPDDSDAFPQRSQVSSTVRMMALGMAVGFAVCLVAGVLLVMTSN